MLHHGEADQHHNEDEPPDQRRLNQVGAEPAQRSFECRGDVLRSPVAMHGAGRGVVDDEPALGGEDSVVTAVGQRLADQFLVRERAVHV